MKATRNSVGGSGEGVDGAAVGEPDGVAVAWGEARVSSPPSSPQATRRTQAAAAMPRSGARSGRHLVMFLASTQATTETSSATHAIQRAPHGAEGGHGQREHHSRASGRNAVGSSVAARAFEGGLRRGSSGRPAEKLSWMLKLQVELRTEQAHGQRPGAMVRRPSPRLSRRAGVVPRARTLVPGQGRAFFAPGEFVRHQLSIVGPMARGAGSESSPCPREARMFRPVDPKVELSATGRRHPRVWRGDDVFSRKRRRVDPRGGPARTAALRLLRGPADRERHARTTARPHARHQGPLPALQDDARLPRAAEGGWDTHGLPVEVEVEKELGIHGKAEIEAYGVEPFTQKCSERVFRYTTSGSGSPSASASGSTSRTPTSPTTTTTSRACWWALQALREGPALPGLQGRLPWCPRCGTALSEPRGRRWATRTSTTRPSSSTFRAVEPTERLRRAGSRFLVAWTTTPWTLPANICAGGQARRRLRRRRGRRRASWWSPRARRGARRRSSRPVHRR